MTAQLPAFLAPFQEQITIIEARPGSVATYYKLQDRLLCPCCRFPTLSSPSAYEICPICGWEDDGQGDHNAREHCGGPNGKYSLSEARENFDAHLHMYNAGEGVAHVERRDRKQEKLLSYVKKVIALEEPLDIALLDSLVPITRAVRDNGDGT
ncbi:CPCC family cysteine-rich protein [Halovulum sp. GXIMD14793]